MKKRFTEEQVIAILRQAEVSCPFVRRKNTSQLPPVFLGISARLSSWCLTFLLSFPFSPADASVSRRRSRRSTRRTQAFPGQRIDCSLLPASGAPQLPHHLRK
jgi:hypothetical protein